MKCTDYFLHTRTRSDRTQTRDAWIKDAIDHPVWRQVQTDGRIRVWAFVADMNRYLRVILLDDGETVHNAFFDRSFKEDRS